MLYGEKTIIPQIVYIFHYSEKHDCSAVVCMNLRLVYPRHAYVNNPHNNDSTWKKNIKVISVTAEYHDVLEVTESFDDVIYFYDFLCCSTVFGRTCLQIV